jgi:hypothetical protein
MDGDARAYFLLTIAIGIFILLWFLGAMARREWVKTELLEKSCKPTRIWWVPFAYWAPFFPFFFGPAFLVIYTDSNGFVHKAKCWTSNVSPRKVVWAKDELI